MLEKQLLERTIDLLKETNGHLNRLVTLQKEANTLLRVGLDVKTITPSQQKWVTQAKKERSAPPARSA